MDTSTTPQALVFYDGACPVCVAEIGMIRRWDHAQHLAMIDIAAPAFDAHAWPVSVADMNTSIQVRLPDGTWQNGMVATRYLYRAVGRGWMLAPTGWPLLARAFDRCYAWFARHRIAISVRLGLRRCATGADGCIRHHLPP
jgi:predicted DCC family thiol-disulfide oxidoreductase YuxK